MHIREDRAAYRVLAVSGFYGPDDHLYAEGSVIYYDDEPNLEFEPMNSRAREHMDIYINKLDNAGRAAAEKAGRPYLGLPKSLDDAIQNATADARRVEVVKDDGGIPLMGAKKRGRPAIERIEEFAETPQDGRKAPARGSMSVA